MNLPLVFIDGDQGTTGLLIAERLRGRTDIRVLALPPAERKDPLRRAEALNRCDIAILCLPDAAAREAVAMIENPAVRVLDASSAHRSDAPWVYGFAEMTAGQAARIAAARRVANPGCYPTGAIALLRPLVEAGLLPADHPLAVHAVSGYSGRGRAGIDAHEGPAATGAPALQLYGLALAHKHVPEMQQQALLAAPPVFVPAYGAYRQGIVLTVALHRRLLPHDVSGQRLRDALQAHYAAAPEVQVLSAADTAALVAADRLDPQQHNGSNRMSLAVFESPRGGDMLLAAVFDNLGKGASDAAVQNLDLMLGATPATPAAQAA